MPNHLAHETSPYLLQHADNPVDWHPWSDAALSLARTQDRPILLSVGYSACHWCHVMAHESFEDPEVAAVMNRLFINIKVDREERPDIDQIYQTAHQVLAQRPGGWPLTMFLAPDGRPFYGGTYFPKAPRYNLPGFVGLLERVAEVYATQREAIDTQNGELLAILGRTVPVASEDGAIPGLEIVTAAREELRRLVDAREGGLGAAPKFPHPFEFDFLLRESVRTGDVQARDLALLTLRKMADGGIYDHLGGGFCRYSVDGTWTIPHFEKMLYDNGPLLRLYADAWVITRDPLFGMVCEETAAWVIREMQAPEGGYYSSIDADSEGEEGRFYVWTPEQVQRLVSADEYPPFAARYGLDGAPNFEGEYWHLRVVRTLTEVAAATGTPEDACAALIASARAKLFAVRGQRVWPGRDDKILTSWNAEMIEGMARAARVFGRDDWLASARRALEFLRGTLWRDGRLMATHKDGRTHLNAYLDDHAFLLAALLEMLQADFRADDLAWAIEIADVLLDRFEDPDAGGFWFTSHDHEALILRTKPGLDNATPAGNGIAAMQLQRLGHLVGDERYLHAAERTLRLFADSITQHTGGSTTLVTALAEYAEPPSVVVLRGEPEALGAWRRQLAGHPLPSTLVLAVPQGLPGLPVPLDRPAAPGGRVNAWVCRGVTCLAPMQSVDEVLVAMGVAAN